jgi:hypothetical protein
MRHTPGSEWMQRKQIKTKQRDKSGENIKKSANANSKPHEQRLPHIIWL